MRVFFIHQNFPAQYRHVASILGRSRGFQVLALGEVDNVRRFAPIPGVTLKGYTAPQPAQEQTQRYVRSVEAAVHRAQRVAQACLALREQGYVPDLVCVHPGWGEAIFVRDIFPKARITLYCEFYYHAEGSDVGFDPEYPATLDDRLNVRVKNAPTLLALAAADSGISPTRWQQSRFPPAFQDRIAIAHEGVDTDLVTPDAQASLSLPDSGLVLTARDQVITYVARNLEPYRGFHIFMRALPEILRRCPAAHVVIVGDVGVSYGQQLPVGQTHKQKMLDEVGSSLDLSRVHFLGKIPYATLLTVYRISKAHVYLTYPFVLSWSFLEAMSAGCAVVASRTAPVEEVVSDRENGFLVDFFQPGELADRVEEVLSDHSATARLRDRARQSVIERYDLRRVCLPAQLDALGVGSSLVKGMPGARFS